MVASLRRHARLHLRQGRGARHDALVRTRPRQAPHPRQHDRPRLGDDGAAENALGQPGGARAQPRARHAITRSFARDLGKHRIRVNTSVPGWVMTERQKTLWVTPAALERNLARQCLPLPIEPVYLARMALFLASDDSAMCTSNNYMVEAGSI